MTFTVLVTVEVEAESRQDARTYIRHALENSKKAEIVLIAAEVTAEREDDA